MRQTVGLSNAYPLNKGQSLALQSGLVHIHGASRRRETLYNLKLSIYSWAE